MQNGPVSKIGDFFNQQFPENFKDPFEYISFYLDDKDLVSLSLVNKQALGWTYLEKQSRTLPNLLPAVVEGNQDKAERIIKFNPGFLGNKDWVAKDHLGRIISGKTAFQLALCMFDDDMCEMMKPYFLQIEGGEAEMARQFNEIFPHGLDAHIKAQKANAFDFNPILEAIKIAPPHEVRAALNKEFHNVHFPLIRALNEFRRQFQEKSLSETIFNPFHILKARETYNTEFDNLGNQNYWDKRDLFWRQVIGLAQRLAVASIRQALWQGIYFIVERGETLRRGDDFRQDGGSIIPISDFSGEGFDYALDGRGARATTGFRPTTPFFQNLCRAKISNLEELLSAESRPRRARYA